MDMKKTQETDREYKEELEEKAETAQDTPGIEQCFERLDAMLSEMEAPDCRLEESFRLYEEGVRLIRTARQQISRVEQRLQILDSTEGGQEAEEEKDGL